MIAEEVETYEEFLKFDYTAWENPVFITAGSKTDSTEDHPTRICWDDAFGVCYAFRSGEYDEYDVLIPLSAVQAVVFADEEP
jgi:hypothetical protein